MTEMTTKPLSDYSGFDLAIGSVFAVRWFSVDREGRLRGRHYDSIWKPGENVATCRREDSSLSGAMYRAFSLHLNYTFDRSILGGSPTTSLADEAVEAKVEIIHEPPAENCRCGFYAYAEDCDDKQYASDDCVQAIVECYGRVILGTKGLRAEKARIVAFTGASQRTRSLYPDVRHFRKPKWMLRAFDVVQPAERNPETDPTFWGAS